MIRIDLESAVCVFDLPLLNTSYLVNEHQTLLKREKNRQYNLSKKPSASLNDHDRNHHNRKIRAAYIKRADDALKRELHPVGEQELYYMRLLNQYGRERLTFRQIGEQNNFCAQAIGNQLSRALRWAEWSTSGSDSTVTC